MNILQRTLFPVNDHSNGPCVTVVIVHAVKHFHEIDTHEDMARAGMHYDRFEEQSRAKEVAAVKIQAGWRGRVGRIEGRAHLKVRTA